MFYTYCMAICSALPWATPSPGTTELVKREGPGGVIENVLMIEGLDDPANGDEIEIIEEGLDLWVRTIGETSGGIRVLKSDVDRIEVALWQGDDIFDAEGIDVPMTVSGGYGVDYLTTGVADDFVMGDDGDDVIATGAGNDRVLGGSGADTIDAGDGDDIVYGYVPVSSHSAIVYCFQDADTIDGGPGSDYIEGGPDNDTIYAGVETYPLGRVDMVYGYVPAPDDLEIACPDNDVIEAAGSVLWAWAGPGDDHVYGGDYGDHFWGGTGKDELVGAGGIDDIQGGEGDDEIKCGEGDDFASGGSGMDHIHGGPGVDTLSGDDDTDFIWGGPEGDTIDGGAGNDLLDGGDGNDRLRGNGGDDSLIGGAGDDDLAGGPGMDDLWGSIGNDRLAGGAGRDRLWGEDGSDLLVGGVTDNADDELYGGSGDDRLYGGGGSDSLSGEMGDDLLVSVDGWNDDLLDGGFGFDSFWFDPDEAPVDASTEELESNVHEVERIRNFEDYSWDGDDVPDPNLAPDLRYEDYSSDPQPPRWGSLFGSGGPERADVDQGGVGSCWLVAGLAAAATVNQNVIRQAIIELPDGTFLVEWNGKHYRQDADLPEIWIDPDEDPTTPDGYWSLAYAELGNESALWVAVLEKAVADTRFGIGEIFTYGEYDSAAVGTTAETFRKLGGDGRSLAESLLAMGKTLTPESMADYIDECLDRNEAVGCTTFGLLGSAVLGSAIVGSGFDHLYAPHAYMAMLVIRDGDGQPVAVRLYNPWGVDVQEEDLAAGSKSASGPTNKGFPNEDGIVEVPILEFYISFKYGPLQIAISDFSRFDE